ARSNAAGGSELIGSIDAFTGISDPSFTVGPTIPPKNAHSIAADAVTNQVFVPIPGSPHNIACGQGGGHNSIGCILVLKGTNDGDDENDCQASGTPSITTDAFGNPLILRTTCFVVAPIPPG